MTEPVGITLRWPQVVLASIVLVAIGAAGMSIVRQPSGSVQPQTPIALSSPAPAPAMASGGTPSSSPAPDSPLSDVTVTLSSDAVRRAGIELTTVGTNSVPADTAVLRVPGIVQPNGYRSVKVSPV